MTDVAAASTLELLNGLSKLVHRKVHISAWRSQDPDPRMCGILAVLGLAGDAETNRRMVLQQSRLQRHRGPDNTGCWQSEKGDVVFCFERLHIIDPSDAGM